MTIDEAIKVKEKYAKDYYSGMTPKEKEADKLSIEALIGIKRGRIHGVDFPWKPLPGETEE